MGLAAYGSYYGVYALLPVNVVALAVAIPVSGIVYFGAAMALGAVDEADLMRLPKGHLLVLFGKKCYLLRDPEFERPGSRKTAGTDDSVEKRPVRKKRVRKKVVKKRKKSE
ncbi:MAG: hypothetical protein ACI4SZ_00500, partial [Lachnospiraceae bacterium]